MGISKLSLLYYGTIGRLYCLLRYDRKYLKGPLFQGKLHGICAIGWKIATKNGISCRFFNVNREVRWPVNPKTVVIGYKNIIFNPNDLHIFLVPGCYYQGIGKITIGSGCYIAPNVGIITSNHDFNNLESHLEPKEVVLGERCWVGMNSVILPGVILGPKTIVGAGSIVTHSFPDGNCVIGGNPAKIIKKL